MHAYIKTWTYMMNTYIHNAYTYTHTCIHTHIHAYIRTYIHTFIHTNNINI